MGCRTRGSIEAAAGDRLSFRRFAGIPLSESVPDHSSVWRFREELAKRGLAKRGLAKRGLAKRGLAKRGLAKRGLAKRGLAKRGLAERLLAEVNRQLDAKGLILRRGTLIDATILEAAVRPPGGDAGEVSARDPQAGWTRKNGRSRFGYKAHAAVDEGSGLVREAVTTPADVHDSVPADDLVQGDEQAVYADKAYDSERRRAGLRERGIEPRVMHKARRNRPLRPWQKAFNKAVAPIRAGPGRRRAAVRHHEADLRPPPGALPRLGAQRRPAAGPVRRHQPAPGARPRAGLRGGVCPMRTKNGRREPNR
jgi:transposase, IS5 family